MDVKQKGHEGGLVPDTLPSDRPETPLCVVCGEPTKGRCYRKCGEYVHGRCVTPHTAHCPLARRNRTPVAERLDLSWREDVHMLLDCDLPVRVYDELVDLAYGDWPASWPLSIEDLRTVGEDLGRQFERR